jgi:hypothetical protein
MRTAGTPRLALPFLLALVGAAGAQSARDPAPANAPALCAPLPPERVQELQAGLVALGDPIVVLQQRGAAEASRRGTRGRIEDDLQRLGTGAAWVETHRASVSDEERTAFEAFLKALSDPSLQDGVLKSQENFAASGPQVVSALTEVVRSGNAYLHLASTDVGGWNSAEHRAALARAASGAQAAGEGLQNAFAARPPGDLSAAPDGDARERALGPYIYDASTNQRRYAAALNARTAPLAAGQRPSGSPPPPGTAAGTAATGPASDAKALALAGLADVPIMRDWALPRLDEALHGRPTAAHDDRQFKDAYGAPADLETIADRYFAAVCRDRSANRAATDFLVGVVDARGHTESGALVTAFDWLRQGRLLDVEDSRYGPSQIKTGSLPGNPLLTASYAEWAELDHFAQSVADAADHLAGVPAVLEGAVDSGLSSRPVLRAVGTTAVRAATLAPELASATQDHALDWRGDAVSEWLTSVKNAGWSSLKAVGAIRGSRVDWPQYQAGQRGVRYAAQLRRKLVDERLDFCSAVARRAR